MRSSRPVRYRILWKTTISVEAGHYDVIFHSSSAIIFFFSGSFVQRELLVESTTNQIVHQSREHRSTTDSSKRSDTKIISTATKQTPEELCPATITTPTIILTKSHLAVLIIIITPHLSYIPRWAPSNSAAANAITDDDDLIHHHTLHCDWLHRLFVLMLLGAVRTI
jgi:hypothetical protein